MNKHDELSLLAKVEDAICEIVRFPVVFEKNQSSSVLAQLVSMAKQCQVHIKVRSSQFTLGADPRHGRYDFHFHKDHSSVCASVGGRVDESVLRQLQEAEVDLNKVKISITPHQ